jgi:hypothetical protein
MHVILPMERPPQKDARICHRMDRLLTTNKASANDTATSILQDECIVAPRAQPLLDKGTILLDRLRHKGFCGLLIEERARTTYMCELLEASQQLRISMANVSRQRMPSPSLVVLEPTSSWVNVDAGTSSPLSASAPEVLACSGNRDQARTDALSALASSSRALHGFLGLPGFPSRMRRAKVASIASLKRSVPKTRHWLRVARISCNRPASR